MSHTIVDYVKTGDRIQLFRMPDDPDPIPAGTLGTVRGVVPLHVGDNKQTQILVKWDNGRALSCLCPPDEFSLVPEKPVGSGVVSPVV